MRVPIPSLSLLLALAAMQAGSAQAPRALSFVHTHSGEQVECVFAGGRDDAGCLARLKHLLRDWRNGEQHDVDRALFELLHDLRAAAGVDAPYEIVSAYRAPQTNELLRNSSGGVAENSLHMQGKAIDVRLRGYPTRKLHQLALSLRRGGVGYYAESDFVHVDTGRVRSW